VTIDISMRHIETQKCASTPLTPFVWQCFSTSVFEAAFGSCTHFH
jgi:hypothetical protein